MSTTVRRAGLALLAAGLAFAGAVYGVTRPASADVAAQLTAPQLVADMGAGWNLGNRLYGLASPEPCCMALYNLAGSPGYRSCLSRLVSGTGQGGSFLGRIGSLYPAIVWHVPGDRAPA